MPPDWAYACVDRLHPFISLIFVDFYLINRIVGFSPCHFQARNRVVVLANMRACVQVAVSNAGTLVRLKNKTAMLLATHLRERSNPKPSPSGGAATLSYLPGDGSGGVAENGRSSPSEGGATQPGSINPCCSPPLARARERVGE